MKKNYALLFVLLFSRLFVSATWHTCGLKLSIDWSETTYALYKAGAGNLSQAYWLNSDEFDSEDLGTVSALKIIDVYGYYSENLDRTDGVRSHDSESFKFYYRVYPEDAEEFPKWETVAMENVHLHDYISIGTKLYEYVVYNNNETTDMDVLSNIQNIQPLTKYVLEVAISKKEYWTDVNTGVDKSWNSMIPGGQGKSYNANNPGYKATFTTSDKISTNIEPEIKQEEYKVSVDGNLLGISFNGKASIQIFSVEGKLIVSKNAEGSYVTNLNNGTYIVIVNGGSPKKIII